MPRDTRHPEIELPYEGKPGVCVFCGRPLPPRKRRWCGECAVDYLRARGFTYRQDCIARVVKEFGTYHCEMCGHHFENGVDDTSQWQVDHKVPLALGGSHDLSNLWLLCPKCCKEKNAADQRDIYHALHPTADEPTQTRAKDRRLSDFNG